ncbi:MAG TPA: hypothetical protein VKY74_20860 [Chloroflexia bacterium]|nr:hypothetical protein [Chloroflexia bacterium]
MARKPRKPRPPLPPPWQGSPDAARIAVRRFMESLGLATAPVAEVARTLTREAFHTAHLGSLLRRQYADSPYHAATDVYPHLATWRQEDVESDYWTGQAGIDRAQAATRRLLTEFMVAAEEPSAIAAAVPRSVFEWVGLGAMLDIIYAGSASAALRAVVPGIRPWRQGRVPNGWWKGLDATEHAQAATRQMIGELGWGGLSADELALRVRTATFRAHGLQGMLKHIYGDSPYAALADLYPQLQPWQMDVAPNGYWLDAEGRGRARRATRWLLARLGLLGRPPAEIAAALNAPLFTAHGLSGMLQIVYNNSPYAALVDLDPAIQPWQMGMAPAGYWQGPIGQEHARTATRWLLEQLGLATADPHHIGAQVDLDTFATWGLGGMVMVVYENSPYAALADVVPGLQPWHMAVAPNGYWLDAAGREHARAATRWLLTQRGLSAGSLPAITRVLDAEAFAGAGLGGMLRSVYGGSPHAAVLDLDLAVQPWQLGKVPAGYWQGARGPEHARAATRWLLEQLNLSTADPTTILETVTARVFQRLGLGGMLSAVYADSAPAALAAVLPAAPPPVADSAPAS